MIFTLVYMYSTFMQWWRLGILRNKLNGTLNSENALLVAIGHSISDPKHQRVLECLLFQHTDRIGCTIVPRQKVNLTQWVNFPKDAIHFPIHIGYAKLKLQSPSVFVLVQALLEKYVPHEADIIEIEKFGELLAWRAVEHFEVILRCDMENVTKLVSNFAYNNIDINHELQLLRVETVDVDGSVTKIKYSRKYPAEEKLKYSVSEVHWKEFTKSVKELYNKIYDAAPHPKITIEGGSRSDDSRKVPISEVKPIKKETKKDLETSDDRRDTLNVNKPDHRPTKGDKRKEASPQKDHRAKPKPDACSPKAEATSSRNCKPQEGASAKPSELHKPKDHKDHSYLREERRTHREEVVDRKDYRRDSHHGEQNSKDPQKHKEARVGRRTVDGEAKSKDEIDHRPRDQKYKDTKTSSHRALDCRLKERARESKCDVTNAANVTSVRSISSHKNVDKKHHKPAKVSKSSVVHMVPEITNANDINSNDDIKIEDPNVHNEPEIITIKGSKAHESDFRLPVATPRQSIASISMFSNSSAGDVKDSNSVKIEINSAESILTNSQGSAMSQKSVARDASTDKTEVDNLQCDVKPGHTFTVTGIIQEKNIVFTESKAEAQRMLENTKPPNILVYADSLVAKENVKDVLNTILNKEKYTIYDLPITKADNFWDESTTLVVVCGNVTPTLTSDLLQYLVNGGQLLCLCSDLLYSVLQTFSTAEVREHELVRFSYDNWKRVRMMHHIFCYQASPAKKQFSKDSDQSNHSNGSSPVAPRTPSTVVIQHGGNSYTVQVQVLGTEETWQTPSLLLASVKGSKGRAIFSQVHLEVDPTQYQEDESKYTALIDSNEARLEILKHILSNHLDIVCSNENSQPTYTIGYFLGRHDMKLQLLNECENITDNSHTNQKLTMVFCGKDDDPGISSATRLPVMILSCPANFSTVQYYETLQTQDVGRLVIYSDILTSSQDILMEKLRHGLVVIARQQTHGVGRSSNVWLSPLGCAMFSLQLHISMSSVLGKSLPLVQHLIMVAIVSAVRNLPGYEEIDIGLKWPNDLYVYSGVKIGGLVVTSQIRSDVAVVNIGCGVNLNNSDPTTCLNDVITNHNSRCGTTLEKISYERFFAIVFNEVERILNVVQNGDIDFLFDLYYKYWLHGGSEISVMTKEGQVRKVKIIGVDDFGYLTVQSSDGSISSVQPDGNTFDMLKGLIAPKIC